jgi:DNA-binding NarL/FixJ family response regulator
VGVVDLSGSVDVAVQQDVGVLVAVLHEFDDQPGDVGLDVRVHDLAMRNGVKMGPRFKLTEHQRGLVAKRMAAGESTRQIARDFNVSHNTIARLR